VKKIRALVSAKTISINLLLNMHTSEGVSRLESRGQSQHNELLRNIEEHRLKFQGISRRVEEVKDQVVQAHQAASKKAESLETAVQSGLERISEKTTYLAQSMSGLRLEVSSAQNSILSLQDSSSQIMVFLRKFP
jgi:dsDNA-specific endonuclease/ATPase MutS2